MPKKRNEYLEYRRNKKIAKRELARIAATALPAARQFSEKTTDITKFIIKLAEESKTLQGEKLVEMILNETANMLNAKQERVVQVASYIANLEVDDIKKILVHAMVETSPAVNQDQ